MASSLDIVVQDNVKVTPEEVKQVMDLAVLIGGALKGFIPGTKDDMFIDAIAFGAGKPDVIEFVGRLLAIFGPVNPQALKALTEKLHG